MRRRSSSCIPLPFHNRRDSKVKRSRSTVREPSLDGQTPLATKLASTPLGHRLGAGYSDQKYKMQRGSQRTSVTPITYTGSKRSGSSFGSRVSLTQTSKSPLEKVQMQKLLNDKKWVSEQYSKVQSFIQSSGLFNPEIAGMIRPPTIKIFVEIVSVLFQRLVKTNPINTQNYADVILSNLKLLRYPGTITLSTIKTANTMHGWPHFISILSWLIDKVNLGSSLNSFYEQQDEDLQKGYHMQNDVFEFLSSQYVIYINAGGTAHQDSLVESENKLFDDLSANTGTDHNVLKSLEQPLEACRIEVAELDRRLDEVIQENQQIEAENLKKMNAIKTFKEHPSTKEQEVEEELVQLRKTYTKQLKYEEELISSVKDLEKNVSSQSCRYKEKTEILGQIEDLKRAIARKEGNLNEYRTVRDELDHLLKTMVTEIEAKVDAWNVSITKTLLPEFQNLHLRDKGFHSRSFIEEIKEICIETSELDKKLLEEFKTIKFNIIKLEDKMESLLKNNEAMDATRKKLESLKHSVQSSKEENNMLLFEIEEVKKKHDANLVEIEHLEGSKLKSVETESAQIDDRIQKLTQEINKTAKKGVSVMVATHGMVVKGIQKVDEQMHAVLSDISAVADKSKQNVMKTYEDLLSLQKKTSEMIEDLNEANKENSQN